MARNCGQKESGTACRQWWNCQASCAALWQPWAMRHRVGHCRVAEGRRERTEL